MNKSKLSNIIEYVGGGVGCVIGKVEELKPSSAASELLKLLKGSTL
jgi:hypothetical protein